MAKQLKLNLDTTILDSMDSGEDPKDLADYSDIEIEMLFESAFANYHMSEFLESIYDQWQETGKLTEKQWQGLLNTVARTRKEF